MPDTRDLAERVADACMRITGPDGLGAGREYLAERYPVEPVLRPTRVIPPLEAARVFVRDGFLDRYSGERLVFPGVLRLLSHLMPREFPFHPGWKRGVVHPAYWDLYPTIDHIIPVARGGPSDPWPENWVTTSMRRNAAKADWTLDELGWSIHPAGSLADWDGLLHWFLEYLDRDTGAATVPVLRRWRSVARGVIGKA